MMDYKSQVGEGKYSIQLDTDVRWVYREVERFIRCCMDTERLFRDGLIGKKADTPIIDEGDADDM